MSDDDTTGSDTPPPPRGPWSDVLDQVRDALEDAGIGAQEITSELMEGVRLGLDALSRGPEAGPPPDPSADVGPEVRVVPGGRGEGEPPAPGPRPDLKVAEPEPERGGPSALYDDAADAVAASNVSVRVRTVDRGDGRGGLPRGDIAVSPDAPAQTVFRGATPRPYRVRCVTGALRVELDGQPADQLSAGQSMDVEAGLIRVSAADGAAATGSYLRLAR